ncbi:HDOD domain-containing protein [Planctomicrobium sp. SH664]|uniref:HDOD domain-containing protein n=1 Tax=Planctomicrobium sp. SH664 TaxID=3448125 RepID=UPI003F5CA90F
MVSPASRLNRSETITIPARFMDRMCRHLPSVQMLPAIALEALELAKDPDCRVSEFAKLLKRDVRLATDILRMVNSSLYAVARPIVSLTEAAVRLGLNQCRNFIITTSLASLVENLSLQETWIREILWQHSRLTAVIAANLNRELRIGFQGEEFSAGLLHDIGRILLAVSVPEEFQEMDTLSFQEGIDPLECEQDRYGITHAELGAWLAMRNQLPGCLVSAIRYHHQPQLASNDARLTALVATADHLANFAQRQEPEGSYCPAGNEALPLLEATGVPFAAIRFGEIAERVLEKSQTEAGDLARR